MWQERVYFYNHRGEKLSGILDYPENIPQKAVLLLSPHPHLGGDMHNNVLTAITKALHTTSSIILRFDYHGTGESQVHLPADIALYDYYENLEQNKNVTPFLEDSIAGWDFLTSCVPEKNVKRILIGYSLGGYLSFFLMQERPADKILVLVPPLSKYPPIVCDKKVFCLCATDDFLTASDFPSTVSVDTIPKADHFFRGKEEDVACWVLSIMEDDQDLA